MASSLPQARSEAPWHRLGMGLSALCLVHCLALPWLLTSLPVILQAALPEALRDTEWLHVALILPVLLVSGPVLLSGHSGWRQAGIVLAGFAALIGGLLAGSETVEQTLTISGAGLLMAAHAMRLRASHPH